MESDDMNISTSEEDDPDDDPELDKLLSSLNGMEKCLLPVSSECVGKTLITQEEKPVSKTISNKNNNSQDRAKTSQKMLNSSNPCEEIEFREVDIISISSPVSLTNLDDSNHSNASTLSRNGTPERRPFHCPKNCDNQQVKLPKHLSTVQNLNDINQCRKNLNNDVAYIGRKCNTVSLDAKSVNDSVLSKYSGLCAKTNDSIMLDLDTSSANNTSSETQFKQIIHNCPSEVDSDSDCLIIEHFAASAHRQNGLIDLTKLTSDDEASLSLQERTEESLLKEISKIRKALTKTKHTKKKRRKKVRKKHKSTKKTKISKSKNCTKLPSLERVCHSEIERTIVISESGQLRVNVLNNRSKTVSEDFDDSDVTSKSTKTILPVNKRDEKLPPKDSNCGENSTSAMEKSPKVMENSINTISCKKSRLMVDSYDDKISTLRMNSPDYGIVKIYYRGRSKIKVGTPSSLLHHRRRRSRSYHRSLSRSSRYRRLSSSSYYNFSHSHRRKSCHKTLPKNSNFNRRKSISKLNLSDELSFSDVYNKFIDQSQSNRSNSRTSRNPSCSLRSPISHRSESRSIRSRSWCRRTRSSSRSSFRRSNSRAYSHRNKSRAHQSPSRSRRSKSHRKTPKKRLDSSSPLEIRAARKCGPLENMRQQLRKNNEATVLQALGSLKQPKKSLPVRIIGDVDLTESPSPERTSTICHKNATPVHPYAGYFQMPVSIVQNSLEIFSQMNVFQISHVFNQAERSPENYLPLYQSYSPYM